MKVRDMIRDLLITHGCQIEEEAGIWYITTPEGDKWDMTVPMNEEETKHGKINQQG